ncbi:4-hydroxy-tetrahydrodipicolinate reductase [bacterium E08(2017)]|nr:4-hydroxy-tetrahydrodipicolinate reductase [bacterium E08(2017)]
MTKAVLIGAAGRMGLAIARCAQNDDEIEIVGAIEAAGHPDLGKDIGEVAEIGKIGVPITSDLAEALDDADVAIDFSFHTAVPQNVTITASKRRAFALGTTGLSEEETLTVMEVVDKIPVLWAPNMSLGINLLFAMVEKASKILKDDFLVEVDETHHIHKKDAPSGTALRLAERVADGWRKELKDVMVFDEEGSVDTPPEGKILMHSHREGEVIGDHTVAFSNGVERIEFTHNALSRDTLALGSIKGAKWIVTQKPALYDMQDMLGLRS